MDFSKVGIWGAGLRFGDPVEAAESAAELEELGFGSLWVPDGGGPIFDAVNNLLGATRTAVVATGILNLWMHEPEYVVDGYASVTAAYPDRFLLGIGVGHAPVVDKLRDPGTYRRPIASTAAFLDELDKGHPPIPVDGRILAALGPKMLSLAAERTGGVHPYLVTPEHTGLAREAVGPDKLVLPEQTVILCSTADEARAIATEWLRDYLEFPNYANSLLRLGFTPEDLKTLSDRLFDAMVVWGGEEKIKARIDEHVAAGADQVCVQVLTGKEELPREQWRRLAAALV
ncbi:LLM class F420-dependent oxidoreductase [Nocardia sp. 348MFTsu5.1]|uniref:LLM class F420-dependent oxidoreductase n=1 Tax=Nocardia sp. 348MFTsu5.1 TaxID=1172185 RepID=UPI0003A895A8|nr:LLM class F420-dependent oxidoreductase [Nocardia sp. 348MFTsu5.1]